MHLRPELVLLQRTMVTVEGVARTLDPEINMWEAATPVVRAAIADAIGPKRQFDRLREATLKAIDIAPQLPRYVETIAAASARVSGESLVGGTAASETLMRDLARERRMMRGALIFAGAAALILAAALALR
jgi:ubiquinone biosynthesis protein